MLTQHYLEKIIHEPNYVKKLAEKQSVSDEREELRMSADSKSDDFITHIPALVSLIVLIQVLYSLYSISKNKHK